MNNLSPGNMNCSKQKQHLALRVALDTMKDRCILQQKRLSEVEEENQQLRESLTEKNKPANSSHNAGGVAENFQLRLQVSELQRQNTQLNAHINMVSAENRKLWSRLSQIAKEQTNAAGKDKDATLTLSHNGSDDSSSSPRAGEGTSGGSVIQNLIRSKTFTQHSPNPNLRLKLITADSCDSTEMLDVSLENDVALEVFGDDANRKLAGNNDSNMTEAAMEFGYLNVDETSSTSSQEEDFKAEARKCIEGLQDMRREAMKQQHEISSVFALLESRIALQPCSECVKKSHKPEMADKSLETDESFNDAKYANTTNDLNNLCNSNKNMLTDPTTPTQTQTHLNIIQEKILADGSNKMCPMCGQIFDCQITFESFCEHVEDHFHDDNIDLDHSIEHNFELISHVVGDF